MAQGWAELPATPEEVSEMLGRCPYAGRPFGEEVILSSR